MPSILDPDSILPEKKTKLTPSQIIVFLLYPVVFGVGLTVGLVIGFKQGQASPNPSSNQPTVNTHLIPNANLNVNRAGIESNANASNVFTNSPSVLTNGDYLKLDAATVAKLAQDEQRDKNTLVDQTAAVTDILRQQDLISLKYNLKAYQAINAKYPSTGGKQIHLTASADNVFYQAMKKFYGGTYNLRIDPESPTYYYGYTSNGQSFELTAWLTSKKKAFVLRNTP